MLPDQPTSEDYVEDQINGECGQTQQSTKSCTSMWALGNVSKMEN